MEITSIFISIFQQTKKKKKNLFRFETSTKFFQSIIYLYFFFLFSFIFYFCFYFRDWLINPYMVRRRIFLKKKKKLNVICFVLVWWLRLHKKQGSHLVLLLLRHPMSYRRRDDKSAPSGQVLSNNPPRWFSCDVLSSWLEFC